MMNEELNAGMEIKQEPVFENPNVPEDDVEQVSQPEIQFNMPTIKVSRSKDGLINDSENGKEINSVFEILEVGDNVNHQTIVAIDDKGITLDYFGRKTTLTGEHEVFSVLLKEELEEWKRLLKESELDKMFETGGDMTDLFRSLELMCMNIDMENVDYLAAPDDPLNQRILAMLVGTLRKPIVDSQNDLEGKNVITISYDYSDGIVNVEPKNGKHLYHISLLNTEDLKVNEGDKIILC